jgi:2-keto-4-pentenoate hydratase/2-oxohepta-3-ene-1,7-dioic acid hydratase in catechol pathway
MKLCRFDGRRLGLVEDDHVYDVTAALDDLPALRWPLPPGDPLIAHLHGLGPRLQELRDTARRLPLRSLALSSPVVSPSKVIGAPSNYLDHIEEVRKDKEVSHGRPSRTIEEIGLFLKATSSIVGPAEGVTLRFPERRNDHEVELVVVMGQKADRVPAAEALRFVAGYCIGLDMTLRGPELPSWRKSIETYTVLGPYLVTADEIADPDRLDLSLSVNGNLRQRSNTKNLILGVAKLIAYASDMYVLHAGDVIMTGTPAGVGPVNDGDQILAAIEGLGELAVHVRRADRISSGAGKAR